MADNLQTKESSISRVKEIRYKIQGSTEISDAIPIGVDSEYVELKSNDAQTLADFISNYATWNIEI